MSHLKQQIRLLSSLQGKHRDRQQGVSEWVREIEREGSSFLRPPLISIKWSPVAVGSIAVCLNLIQADSLTHPSPACTHTHTHTAQTQICQAALLTQEVQVAGPVALLPVTMTNTVSWESTQRVDKESERERREFRGEEGLRKVKERNVSLLSLICFWNDESKRNDKLERKTGYVCRRWMCIPKHAVYMQSTQIIHKTEGLWTSKQDLQSYASAIQFSSFKGATKWIIEFKETISHEMITGKITR